jgi:hypothetical protein
LQHLGEAETAGLVPAASFLYGILILAETLEKAGINCYFNFTD